MESELGLNTGQKEDVEMSDEQGGRDEIKLIRVAEQTNRLYREVA
jgi:hypothetical protein